MTPLLSLLISVVKLIGMPFSSSISINILPGIIAFLISSSLDITLSKKLLRDTLLNMITKSSFAEESKVMPSYFFIRDLFWFKNSSEYFIVYSSILRFPDNPLSLSRLKTISLEMG